jgi:hypothetical protein
MLREVLCMRTGATWESSALSVQFCHGSKTAPRNKKPINLATQPCTHVFTAGLPTKVQREKPPVSKMIRSSIQQDILQP